MKRIISIDHGNRMTKTENFSFPSSFVESGHLPSIGSHILKYEGKTYTLERGILPLEQSPLMQGL